VDVDVETQGVWEMNALGIAAIVMVSLVLYVTIAAALFRVIWALRGRPLDNIWKKDPADHVYLLAAFWPLGLPVCLGLHVGNLVDKWMMRCDERKAHEQRMRGEPDGDPYRAPASKKGEGK
jgi:hypothetical protein